MRIALLYPPPWKIPAKGEAPDTSGDGPPADYHEGDLDADFYQTPYGLFSLGAQALRAGHQVKVLNLSAFPWSKVEEVLAGLDADLYGMSCWTANRRGVALTARSLRRHHPSSHIVVGGPHATPLAAEMLAHHPEIDTVCLGESEPAFLELIDRLAAARPTAGIAGTAWRGGPRGRPVVGPDRGAIDDLDTLASPHDHFDTHILMTSRGCPWACTFCGAETTWGRGFRGQSVPYVLDALERLLPRLPVKMVQIKDDTFTTNRKRVLQLCRGIRERKLGFFWSCDTRVDVLGDELLREMRLAGCQRLSLGVESGSPKIIAQVDKKITVKQIVQSTELAKKYGIKVRYFMMLGNRGETAKTFQETLAFLKTAAPHEYIFSCLSIYPGTRDFDAAEKAGWLDREVYFSSDFQELKTPFDASEADTALMNAWFAENSGLRVGYREGAREYRAILDRLGDHHAAHMDLAGALYHEGALDDAERHVRRALDLGYPLPGLAYNYLACIARARGDVVGMMDFFSQAAKLDPQHHVLIQNVQAARAWFAKGGPGKGLPLALTARHDFQLLERTVQPTLPGPLGDDFAAWTAAPPPVPSDAYVKTPDVEGSRASLGPRGRLKVIATRRSPQRMPLPATSSEFPPPPRSLRARSREIATLAAAVRDNHPARLALVGGGGSGKSTLACALGHRARRLFPGGLQWFRVGAWDERTLAGMLALRFGVPMTPRGRALGRVRAHLAEREPTLVVLDNHEDDRAVAALLDALRDVPVTWVITARRCLLAGVSVFPVVPPLVTVGESPFPAVASLTRLLRWNPVALDLADALVASGAASAADLGRRLLAGGVDRVRVIAHEDDLPEVGLLVGFAWELLPAASRRMLAVLAHSGGDHMDTGSLARLSHARTRGDEALAALRLLRLVQEPLAGRFALHATVRHGLLKQKCTQDDPAAYFEHYVSLLEQHPERLELEQTHLFAAMDLANTAGSVGAAVRVERLLARLEDRSGRERV